MRVALAAGVLAAILAAPAHALDAESPEASLLWRVDFGAGAPVAQGVSLVYRGADGPGLALPLFQRSYRLHQREVGATSTGEIVFWAIGGAALVGYVAYRINDHEDADPGGTGAY